MTTAPAVHLGAFLMHPGRTDTAAFQPAIEADLFTALQRAGILVQDVYLPPAADPCAVAASRLLGCDPLPDPRSGRRASHVPAVDWQRSWPTVKRMIVGISGASGVIYGVRLLEVLRGVRGIQTHVVVSPAARRTLALETDLTIDYVNAIADTVYRPGDIAAAISSGSFRASGMIIAPCSIKTVSGIAMSYSDNLLVRAADVTLKERRPLVLLVRETPLHLGHLRLLRLVTELGAVVMPPVPAFYHRPGKLEEVIDQTVNRALDVLGVELDQELFPRWHGPAAEDAGGGHRNGKDDTVGNNAAQDANQSKSV
jgi:flavin prenyltransferase